MAVRDGMSNLIGRLRALTNAGTADHSLAGVDYFSDQHLQDVLDGQATHVEGNPLRWLPDTVAGAATYRRAFLGYRDLEEAESGTECWLIADSSGNEQGTAGYTADYITGMVRFDADQGGSAYYWTGRSYDLNSAAADVWQRKQAFYASAYDFESDAQAFKRSQLYKQAVEQERLLRERAGQNTMRGNMSVTLMTRTDLRRMDY
jgi:hypothetical protein